MPRSTATPWPASTDIGLARGLIITAFLLVCLPLLEVIVVNLAGTGYVIDTIKRAAIILPVHILSLVMVGFVVQKWGGIHFKSLFRRLPTLREGIIWGMVGALFGLTSFYNSIFSGYRFENLETNIMALVLLVKVSFITPLLEEIEFRAVFYAALRKKGRILAYAVSSVVFTLSHAQSYGDLFLHGSMGLSTGQIAGVLLAGLVFAHIYETTGKLLVCVICHAMINGMEVIGYAAGHLFDV